MDYQKLFSELEQHAHAIESLTRGILLEQARWKPNVEAWSILEVINHLLDEERRDFRVRLDIILHRPAEPFPPIDPPRWVVEEKYNERELESSVKNFMDERIKSLKWLDGLGAPNWEASVQAPWGELKAGDMFAAWVAHDVLHLRQLVELHFAFVKENAQPYAVGYAGDW